MSENDDTKFEYDVYISFHSKQLSQAENASKIFKNADLNVWFVEDSTNKFDENMHALQNSYLFICFLSIDYQKAIRNRIEHSIAVGQNIKMMNFINSDLKMSEPIRSSSNCINFNLNSMNEDSMYVLAKSIKKEMEQNLRSKILKKKSQEMESALENFKQLFEKTITACQVLDKKQKISFSN